MDWINLPEQEIKAIHDKRDYPLISLIKSLSDQERGLIDKSIIVKDEYKGEYIHLQEPWIRDFKTYWRENHHKNPTGCVEFGEDLTKSGEGERYKLYYSAHNPDKIEVIKVNSKTLEFLSKAIETVKIVNLTLDNSVL
jgi:hypothetical protein